MNALLINTTVTHRHYVEQKVMDTKEYIHTGWFYLHAVQKTDKIDNIGCQENAYLRLGILAGKKNEGTLLECSVSWFSW